MRDDSAPAPRSLVPLLTGCVAALAVPLVFPLLTGRVFTKDDLGALHLPFRYLYQDALLAGEFLLWTPAYHAGFFLFGAGEAGMAHPLHFLLYRFLPLGPAINLEILSSYVLAFVGSVVFLRRLGLSAEGRIVGAMTFTFSGFMLFNLFHVNHIATVAHVPALLAAFHWLLTTERPSDQWRASATGALIVGSQWLSGNPQYLWYTLIAAGYLTIGVVVAYRVPQRILMVGATLLVGTAVGAVQLLPTLDFYVNSTRAAWSADLALSFSLHPLNLIQLWSPLASYLRVFAPPSEEWMVHEFIVYNGAFCTLSLAWAAVRWRHIAHRRLLISLIGFAILALLLAFGRHGVFYAWLAELPGLRGVRAPARHLVLFHMALSGIACIAFEDMVGLVRRRGRVAWKRLWPVWLLVALCVVTTGTAASLEGTAWANANALRLSPLYRSGPAAALFLGTAGLMVLAGRGVRWTPAAIALCLTLDLGAWGYTYLYRWGPIESVARLAAQAQIPEGSGPGDVIPPIVGGRDYLAILRGLRLTFAYTGLYPAMTLDPANEVVQRLAGITWRGDGDRWERVQDSVPRARLVAEAQMSNNVAADLSAVDIGRVALVEIPLKVWGKPGEVDVLQDRPGFIEVDTRSNGQQILVLTERYNDGWVVLVDGVSAPAIRVYGDFLGCVIGPGVHNVILRFAPRSVTVGVYVTGVGLGLVLLMLVASKIQRASG